MLFGKQQFSDISLADIAYTLQVGREAMEERLAMYRGINQELAEKLKGFVAGQDSIEDLYRGQVKRNKETLAIFAADEDMAKTIDAWISKGKYAKLLDLWVKGLVFDWNRLYGDTKPRRISLPTYPFAKERYWVPESETKSGGSTTLAQPVAAVIHPLLQQNTSDLSEQRYQFNLYRSEFFLADHVVKGQRVLPGVAYLEMARAAVDQAAGTLKDGQTRIAAEKCGLGQARYRRGTSRSSSHSDSTLKITVRLPMKSTVIQKRLTQNQCLQPGQCGVGWALKFRAWILNYYRPSVAKRHSRPSQCYEAFRAVGLTIGPGHQGLEKVYVGQESSIGKAVPASFRCGYA